MRMNQNNEMMESERVGVTRVVVSIYGFVHTVNSSQSS